MVEELKLACCQILVFPVLYLDFLVILISEFLLQTFCASLKLASTVLCQGYGELLSGSSSVTDSDDDITRRGNQPAVNDIRSVIGKNSDPISILKSNMKKLLPMLMRF
jgi:hypothetical protein